MDVYITHFNIKKQILHKKNAESKITFHISCYTCARTVAEQISKQILVRYIAHTNIIILNICHTTTNVKFPILLAVSVNTLPTSHHPPPAPNCYDPYLAGALSR